jgi:hypothetical protein
MTKMAKYYVDDGYEQAVVDSENPLSACCKAVLHFFNTFAVNGFYKVSEKGFDEHHDDIIVDSNKIIDLSEKGFDEHHDDIIVDSNKIIDLLSKYFEDK